MSRSPAHQTGRGAIVIGGSMSGLFTAAFLKKIGWRWTSTNAHGPSSLAAEPGSPDTPSCFRCWSIAAQGSGALVWRCRSGLRSTGREV